MRLVLIIALAFLSRYAHAQDNDIQKYRTIYLVTPLSFRMMTDGDIDVLPKHMRGFTVYYDHDDSKIISRQSKSIRDAEEMGISNPDSAISMNLGVSILKNDAGKVIALIPVDAHYTAIPQNGQCRGKVSLRGGELQNIESAYNTNGLVDALDIDRRARWFIDLLDGERIDLKYDYALIGRSPCATSIIDLDTCSIMRCSRRFSVPLMITTNRFFAETLFENVYSKLSYSESTE